MARSPIGGAKDSSQDAKVVLPSGTGTMCPRQHRSGARTADGLRIVRVIAWYFANIRLVYTLRDLPMGYDDG